VDGINKKQTCGDAEPLSEFHIITRRSSRSALSGLGVLEILGTAEYGEPQFEGAVTS
jgi:hypothetical protein